MDPRDPETNVPVIDYVNTHATFARRLKLVVAAVAATAIVLIFVFLLF